MAYSLTSPLAAVTDSWNEVSDACSCAGGVSEAERTALSTAMGEAGFESLLLLASLDDDDWEEARKEAKLPMIRRAAANLLYAAVKCKFQVATRINAPVVKTATDLSQTADTAGAPSVASSSKDEAVGGTAGGDSEQIPAQKQPEQQQVRAVVNPSQATLGIGVGSAHQEVKPGLPSPGTAIVVTASNGVPMGEASVGRVNLGLVVNQSLIQEVPMLNERELIPMRER